MLQLQTQSSSLCGVHGEITNSELGGAIYSQVRPEARNSDISFKPAICSGISEITACFTTTASHLGT